ncbi:Aldehyde/histidinol dehydrogenase [Colletotrichum cereale]|nr:Aldehyde/histidinol dehydrogenase [Colletotrichum cereale]
MSNGIKKQTLKAPNGRTIELETSISINIKFMSSRAEPILSINPSDESLICSVQAASADDVDAAIKAARAALRNPEWRKMRGPFVFRFANLIKAHKEDLATLETWDNGRPYQVSLIKDIEEILGVLRYCTGWADKVYGQTMNNAGNYKLGYTWPCGSSRLSVEAGFSPGVINIINGRGPVAGAALCSDPDVDKTRKWANYGHMSNQGQICTATSRLIVHHIVHDDFIARLTAFIKETSVVGDPFDNEIFQGPQITSDQYDRVLGSIERAKQQGATAVLGGGPLVQKPNGKGFFLEPTVFINVTREIELFQEEIFDPVAAVTVSNTEEEALSYALFTDDK